MNFFNIGTAELLLIFAIALIVVGPRRLPEIAQGLGKIVNDLRKMSQEFTAEMMREVNAPSDSKENEAKKIAGRNVSERPVQGLGKIINDVRKISQEFTEEMTRELNVSLDSKENEKSMTNDHPTKGQGPSDQ